MMKLNEKGARHVSVYVNWDPDRARFYAAFTAVIEADGVRRAVSADGITVLLATPGTRRALPIAEAAFFADMARVQRFADEVDAKRAARWAAGDVKPWEVGHQ